MRISDWSSDVCSSDLMRVAAQLLGRALFRCRLGGGGGRAGQHFGVDELVAGGAERLGCLALAEAVDDAPGFADARGPPGAVAVAGDAAEPVEALGVEQVHRVDDHRRVGGVLAEGVAELLDGLGRITPNPFLPTLTNRF